jgi:sialic acid synthase SpsE
LVDIPLIQYVAKTGKPIIMSTGMATLAEIDEAVTAAREAGCKEIALLKCTSAYPAKPEDMNLRTIPNMLETFNVPVGLSDHTLGMVAAVVAVALGACIIEKHFTLSRSIPGPDASFSLEPPEFKSMVDAIRIAEEAVGTLSYVISEKEKASRIFRRSLFVVENIKKDEILTEKNIRSIRPGCALHTRFIKNVLGRKASQDINKGTPLRWDLIA